MTPSDTETITINICEEVRNYYTLVVSKQDLIDAEFCLASLASQMSSDWIDNGSNSDDYHASVDEDDDELFKQWQEEWEEQV